MQTRDHKKLAEMLVSEMPGSISYICLKAFIYGNIEPDKNPFTYLHGIVKGKKFHGHNYGNILPVMKKLFYSLQEKRNWGIREYYHFGKLMHYTADAFTFPHNNLFHGNLKEHCRYEQELHKWFQNEMERWKNGKREKYIVSGRNIGTLHELYLKQAGNYENDCEYILIAAEMLWKDEMEKKWHINATVSQGRVAGQFV
ncbi:MAG: zinc dependent phospholipase C family protein [Muricoprocola sp.]